MVLGIVYKCGPFGGNFPLCNKQKKYKELLSTARDDDDAGSICCDASQNSENFLMIDSEKEAEIAELWRRWPFYAKLRL